MLLTMPQYQRLPGIGRAIVDAERRLGDTLAPKVMSLDAARAARALIRERDDLVRSADKTYGCKLGDRDGTLRS